MVSSSKLNKPSTNRKASSYRVIKSRKHKKIKYKSVLDKVYEQDSKKMYRMLIENNRKIHPSKEFGCEATQNFCTKASSINNDLENDTYLFSEELSSEHPTVQLSLDVMPKEDVICLNEVPPKTKVQISRSQKIKSKKNKKFDNLIESDESLSCSFNPCKADKCSIQNTHEDEKKKSCYDTLESILRKFNLLDTLKQRSETAKRFAENKALLVKESENCKQKYELKKKEIHEKQKKRISELLKKTDLNVDTSSEESSEDESEDEEIRELSDYEMNIYQTSIKGYSGRSLVEKFNYTITVKDITTLKGLNWLNDEVINFYFELIRERSNNNPGLPNIHIMNTYFFTKYLKNGYKAVRRWTKKVDIFDKQFMFIPCHMNQVHWTLCVVNFYQKEVVYYDSMGAKKQNVVDNIKKYLQEEHMDKKKSKIDLSDWKTTCMGCKSPQQHNGSDCGVFTCTTAEFISRNCSLNFCQAEMPLLRKTMVVEIVQAKLSR